MTKSTIETKFIISGFGRFRFIQEISLERAEELKIKGKTVYDSKGEAEREL